MGLVPEESNVYTELTAWDNLMFTARLGAPGLDAQSARAIRELIRRQNAEGATIFLITHQIEEAN